MEKKSAEVCKKIAIQSGMIDMVDDGFLKIEKGITTAEEVFRIIAEKT